MRNKLQTFTRFSDSLLPHEADYLMQVQRLSDPVKLDILRQVNHNCRHINQFTPYNPSIDKRKYSHLKNWIQKRLEQIDVDREFEWMCKLELQITCDVIQLSEEKELLKAVRRYQHPAFYFAKFYELLLVYRQFLLIRMRYEDHALVNGFLKNYREDYERNRRINEQMYQAGQDIVQQYSENSIESIQWERWLTRIFYDESLDGYTRYLAFVRLTFISFNYRKLEMLEEKFQKLDHLFAQGSFYSRRILLNYYNIRMQAHAKQREFDMAIYYGYLSIRGKTHDYLFYVTNLCAVLLRMGKAQEALQVMREASSEQKSTKNYHNRIGFVAFYVKCLIRNQLFRNAESYAETYLKAYEKEILQYRWHTFFASYLEALLHQQKFEKISRVLKKYRITELEQQRKQRADYLPAIDWYIKLTAYKEGQLSRQDCRAHIQADLQRYSAQAEKMPQLNELINDLRPQAPEIFNYLYQGRTSSG